MNVLSFFDGISCGQLALERAKQLNFEDPRSKLFFEFVRMLAEIRETNPAVLFLLENVKMKKEYQEIISQYLGVEPIEINSNLVSAQNRKRLYWTNIPNHLIGALCLLMLYMKTEKKS
jgi:site-specific DNA-cytosine methylase